MSQCRRLAILAALVACRHPQAGELPIPDLLVSVGAGIVEAPDTVDAGWARVRVQEGGQGHILVVFRLSEGTADTDLPGFLATLDTAPATPPQATALGGPEVGDVGEVMLELTPGRYLLACVQRGREHRHAATGEAKLLVVADRPVAATRKSPPITTQELALADFAYVGPDRWPAETRFLRVENRGRQDHQLRLALLRPGASLQDWIRADDPGEVARTVTGVARMGPGAVVFLPVKLAPGRYVAYCLITDPHSRRAHVEMGMFRLIQVDARASGP